MVSSTLSVNQMHGFPLKFGIDLLVGRTAIKHLPSFLAEHAGSPSLDPRTLTCLFQVSQRRDRQSDKGGGQLADNVPHSAY
jgi:hypothetical protein